VKLHGEKYQGMFIGQASGNFYTR